MTTAIRTNRITFAEYLNYFNYSEQESDIKYELVDGELILMALGTGRHGEVIDRIYRSIDVAKIKPTKEPGTTVVIFGNKILVKITTEAIAIALKR
jgi:Uma2 family endonuclease